MQRIGRIGRPQVLVFASLLMLLATTYLYASYGQSAYFVAFHKPFHLPGSGGAPKYIPPVLPHFVAKASIASQSLSPGATQTITITETPDRNVSGYIETWVQSPVIVGATTCNTSCHTREVYENDTSGNPIQFTKGRTNVYAYSYTLPKNLPPGTYKVSYIITSSDTFTDYVVDNNFAEFTVQ